MLQAARALVAPGGPPATLGHSPAGPVVVGPDSQGQVEGLDSSDPEVLATRVRGYVGVYINVHRDM